MIQKADRSAYTSHDFQLWREGGTLELTPKFQRRGVWTLAARSYFIDTLLRMMPVPPIYIRVLQSKDKKHPVRQVVDGQQRVSCVLDFIDGKFRISRAIPGPWAKKGFADLADDEKKCIENYSFSTETFQGISDAEVLQIFARLNTYSVPLNAQELRNGRFFGLFKQAAYELAGEHLEFWRRHTIFTEQKIARMSEAELTSELLIAQLDGMQDKKKSIDDFYKKFDEEFPKREQIERRFRETVDTISNAFPDTLSETEFSRPPLFYSLYCVTYHRRYGLPGQSSESLGTPLTKGEMASLAQAVLELSEIIAEGRTNASIPSRYQAFVAACLRQTDNIRPRQTRFNTLNKRAFG